MLSLAPDLRVALRVLLRDRSFALTALATFALCIGANVAVFAVVNAVLLRPLPLREPDRLVIMFNGYPKAGAPRAGSSVPHFLERRENLKSVVGLAAIRARDAIVGEAGRPERASALRVTPDFFTVLGANAQLGRTFRPEEGEEGRGNVVVLSHAFWQQQFGGDPAAVGRMLRVDGVAMTVVGVMPKDFVYEPNRDARLWVPLAFSAADRAADRRHSNNLEVVGRLAPGASVAQLQAEVDALNAKGLESDPYRQAVVDAGFHTEVATLAADLTRNTRSALWLLQGGALFVLLIGAVNLTNLMLVRANVRAKEVAIRRVLGAGAAAIARQFAVENLLLAAIGGVVGIGVGAALLPALRPLGLDQLPRGADARVDVTVAVVALAAAVVTGVVLALSVLAQHRDGKLAAALSVESRGGTTTRWQNRLREGLIAAQIALAFVLLSGAGLLTLSFARVLKVDSGFQPETLLTAQVNLPRSRFEKPEPRRDYVRRLVAELRALPGVRAVAVSSGAPFTGQTDSNAITPEGYKMAPGESIQAPFETTVAGDFFAAYGIPLRDGRLLTADDGDSEQKIAVIDERFARRYWPGKSPVGQRLIEGTADDPKADRYTIVGVVGAVKQNDLAEAVNVGAVYIPYRHGPSGGVVVSVRTDVLPAALASSLRTAALRVDPDVPVFDLKTMHERVTTSLGARRTPMVLAVAFAGAAIALAIVGIYGVLAYTVAQRRREIGIRLALGALPEEVAAMFVRLGARLLLAGLVVGVPLTWWLGRFLQGQLFGIEPTNPWVLAGGAALVGVAALAAAFVPARRAAATPAMEALRAD